MSGLVAQYLQDNSSSTDADLIPFLTGGKYHEDSTAKYMQVNYHVAYDKVLQKAFLDAVSKNDGTYLKYGGAFTLGTSSSGELGGSSSGLLNGIGVTLDFTQLSDFNPLVYTITIPPNAAHQAVQLTVNATQNSDNTEFEVKNGYSIILYYSTVAQHYTLNVLDTRNYHLESTTIDVANNSELVDASHFRYFTNVSGTAPSGNQHYAEVKKTSSVTSLIIKKSTSNGALSALLSFLEESVGIKTNYVPIEITINTDPVITIQCQIESVSNTGLLFTYVTNLPSTFTVPSVTDDTSISLRVRETTTANIYIESSDNSLTVTPVRVGTNLGSTFGLAVSLSGDVFATLIDTIGTSIATNPTNIANYLNIDNSNAQTVYLTGTGGLLSDINNQLTDIYDAIGTAAEMMDNMDATFANNSTTADYSGQLGWDFTVTSTSGAGSLNGYALTSGTYQFRVPPVASIVSVDVTSNQYVTVTLFCGIDKSPLYLDRSTQQNFSTKTSYYLNSSNASFVFTQTAQTITLAFTQTLVTATYYYRLRNTNIQAPGPVFGPYTVTV